MPYALQLAHGRGDVALRINSVCLPLIWLLTWALATKWGAVGAAVAFVCLNAVVYGWSARWTTLHLIDINIDRRGSALVAGAAVVSTVAVHTVANQWFSGRAGLIAESIGVALAALSICAAILASSSRDVQLPYPDPLAGQ